MNPPWMSPPAPPPSSAWGGLECAVLGFGLLLLGVAFVLGLSYFSAYFMGRGFGAGYAASQRRSVPSPGGFAVLPSSKPTVADPVRSKAVAELEKNFGAGS